MKKHRNVSKNNHKNKTMLFFKCLSIVLIILILPLGTVYGADSSAASFMSEESEISGEEDMVVNEAYEAEASEIEQQTEMSEGVLMSEDDQDDPEKVSGNIKVSKIVNNKGKMVIAGTVDSPYEVSLVKFEVWKNKNKSDLFWYTARKKSDGSFTATVNVKNHKRHFGKYKVYMYITDENGDDVLLARKKITLKAENYVYTEEVSRDKRKVIILNPKIEDAVPDKVCVSAWSRKNDQNDVIKYKASKKKEGRYEAIVKLAKHLHAGKFSAQVLADDTVVASTSFKLKQISIASLKAAKKYSQLITVEGYKVTHAKVNMYTKNGDVWVKNFSVKGHVGQYGIGQAKEEVPITPKGIWLLHTAFGIKEDPGCPTGYTLINENHYWSMLTNRLQEGYAPGEHIIDYGSAYNYCVGIGYNMKAIPGKGSCFFLHCSTGNATAGCVSIPEKYMIKCLKLLREDAHIIIDLKGNIGKY